MRYRDAAEYFLLDTFREDMPGGTGQTFNWDIARMVKERIQKPFFLAGGLTPENVYEAAEKVMPFGVDVCSGIEKSPRRKDYQKMKEFIMKVNEAF
jgi:phosphoribosylanthranilate isomerase